MTGYDKTLADHFKEKLYAQLRNLLGAAAPVPPPPAADALPKPDVKLHDVDSSLLDPLLGEYWEPFLVLLLCGSLPEVSAASLSAIYLTSLALELRGCSGVPQQAACVWSALIWTSAVSCVCPVWSALQAWLPFS